ncbi:NfeD family protein [Cohnella cellulosilytica]|uniref:NfeD family protein n=1 Tax=Cohnella cellulosilytica TaxID=986710 RepID=A0ABW2FCT4_9BACL
MTMEWWAIWLIAAGLLLIAELLTLTYYMLWLSAGAAVASVVSLLAPENYLIQALAGGVAAVALTLLTKPLMRRLKRGTGFRDAHEELVGKQGVVLERISAERPGIVKVGSETWSATSGEELHPDDRVTIVGRSSTVLKVQKTGGMPE